MAHLYFETWKSETPEHCQYFFFVINLSHSKGHVDILWHDILTSPQTTKRFFRNNYKWLIYPLKHEKVKHLNIVNIFFVIILSHSKGLDSRPKGRGFEPHRRHYVVVIEQDTFILA